MKKNLLAMLLAVIMVAAVIFIAAPATKAETVEADITLSADTTETLVIDSDKILNLNGFDATVTINEGVTLTIVDTKFMEGEWDLTGDSAGTLTVAEGSQGAINTWAQFNDYKYLAVKSEAGTYSAHPFNIMVSTVGVNTYSTKITVGITVIADNVVANLIDAGEFGLHNHTLDGQTDHAEYNNRYAKHTAEFNGKNGLRVHFDLTNSLTEDVLTENRSNEFGAYIKVDAGYGALTVDSLSSTEIAPKAVLESLNAHAAETDYFSTAQWVKMQNMLDSTKNTDGKSYLYDYCGKFLPGWKLVTDETTLEDGDRIVIVAKDTSVALGTDANYHATDTDREISRKPVTVNMAGRFVTFGDNVQVLTLVSNQVTYTENETEITVDAFGLHTGAGYLYAWTSGSNQMNTYSTLNEHSSFVISIDDNGVASIHAKASSNRNHLSYNGNVFTCFAADNLDIAVYKYSCEHIDVDNVCIGCGRTTGGMETKKYTLNSSTCTSTDDTGAYLLENGAKLTLTSNCEFKSSDLRVNTKAYFDLIFPEDVQKITVNVRPNAWEETNNCFEVRVSTDGTSWTTITQVLGSEKVAADYTIDLNGSYKYIRIYGTKLSVFSITVNPE